MNVLGVRPQCECGKRGRLWVLAVWALGAARGQSRQGVRWGNLEH